MINRLLARCFVMVFPLLLSACSDSQQTSNQGPSKQHHSNHAMPINVALSRICPKAVNLTISSSARLYASQFTELTPKVGGYITHIPVQEGAFIKQGTTIVQLDNSNQRTELAAAKISAVVAKKQLQRGKSLIASDGISKQELEDLQQSYDLAVNTVKQRQIDLDNTAIKAPFDGFVGQVVVSIGDYVSTNSKLTTVVNTDHLRAVYSIPARYAHTLAVKQKVEIKNYQSTTQAEASVTFVARSINTDTQTIAVTAMLDNQKHQFYPGQDVMITQYIGKKQQALLIPRLSIQTDIGSYLIYRVKDNAAQQVNIKIGDQYGDDVEVTSGLTMNDLIVTKGMTQLHQGSAVNVTSTQECGG